MRIMRRGFWRTAHRAARGTYLHVRLSDRKLGKRGIIYRAGLGTVYDLFLKMHSRKPDRGAYNLLQAFKNYALILDPIIDSQNFREKMAERFGTAELRAMPEQQRLVLDFTAQLRALKLPREKERKIMHIMALFRKTAAKGIWETMQNPFAGKEEVFRGIEKTVGPFLGTASEIAGEIYGIGESDARLSYKAFENFGNALQILDDARDAAKDYGIVQNSIVPISLQYTEAHRKLKQAAVSRRKISRRWIYRNMPNTMRDAEAKFEEYIARIPPGEKTASITMAAKDAFYNI